MRKGPLGPLGISLALIVFLSSQPALADKVTTRDKRNVAADPFDIREATESLVRLFRSEAVVRS